MALQCALQSNETTRDTLNKITNKTENRHTQNKTEAKRPTVKCDRRGKQYVKKNMAPECFQKNIKPPFLSDSWVYIEKGQVVCCGGFLHWRSRQIGFKIIRKNKVTYIQRPI